MFTLLIHNPTFEEQGSGEVQVRNTFQTTLLHILLPSRILGQWPLSFFNRTCILALHWISHPHTKGALSSGIRNTGHRPFQGLCKVLRVFVSCSVMSDSVWPHGLRPARLLCPWGFPGKNTGVGCHFLLQGIFLTQGSNSGLLHCRKILYRLSHQGSLAIYSIGQYFKKQNVKTAFHFGMRQVVWWGIRPSKIWLPRAKKILKWLFRSLFIYAYNPQPKSQRQLPELFMSQH